MSETTNNNVNEQAPPGMTPVSVTRNNITVEAVPQQKQKRAAGQWFLGPDFFSEKYGKDVFEQLGNWMKFFGEDVIKRILANRMKGYFVAAYDEATSKLNPATGEDEPCEFNLEKFLSSVTTLSARSERKEELEQQLEDLLDDFVKCGAEMQRCLENNDILGAKRAGAQVTEMRNEIAGLKASIEKKSQRGRKAQVTTAEAVPAATPA